MHLEPASPSGRQERWKPLSLDLPSPSASPRRSQVSSVLWQKLRSGVASVVQELEDQEVDRIYTTEGPGSDPTSRCSSPDGFYQRRALRAQFGSLAALADTGRLAPEREQFLCQQLDDASEEIDRLCIERDDALKKLHELAKVIRKHELSTEESVEDSGQMERQHSRDESSPNDSGERTPQVRRIATCPAALSPSPEPPAQEDFEAILGCC